MPDTNPNAAKPSYPGSGTVEVIRETNELALLEREFVQTDDPEKAHRYIVGFTIRELAEALRVRDPDPTTLQEWGLTHGEWVGDSQRIRRIAEEIQKDSRGPVPKKIRYYPLRGDPERPIYRLFLEGSTTPSYCLHEDLRTAIGDMRDNARREAYAAAVEKWIRRWAVVREFLSKYGRWSFDTTFSKQVFGYGIDEGNATIASVSETYVQSLPEPPRKRLPAPPSHGDDSDPGDGEYDEENIYSELPSG